MTARRIDLNQRHICGGLMYALMVPVHGYGRDAGSYDVAERGCTACGWIEEKAP